MKLQSLKENWEFRRLYGKGRSLICSTFVIYYLPNRKGRNVYGITTGKKIGNAVHRNRARRIIREAYRQLADELKTGYDFVFVARGKILARSSRELYGAMKKLFASAGLLK